MQSYDIYQNGYDIQKADGMERMLAERNGLSAEEFEGWLQRFCKRKWNCDFSREMTRSAKEIIKDFCE